MSNRPPERIWIRLPNMPGPVTHEWMADGYGSAAEKDTDLPYIPAPVTYTRETIGEAPECRSWWIKGKGNWILKSGNNRSMEYNLMHCGFTNAQPIFPPRGD